jgi:hypothetical protein
VRRLILLLATIGVTVLVASGAALAITYGTDDGEKHRGVGALVDGSGAYCSGTLVDGKRNAKNPTGAPVFVTAAHCDFPGKVYVTFDSTFDITQQESQAIRESKDFTGSTNEKDYEGTLADDGQWYVRGHDIAVVVFKAPDAELLGRTRAKLPTVDALDNLGKGQLFTAVGYGVDQTFANEGVRRYSVSSLTSQNSYFLSLSQQRKKGFAGTCYGDSGGPNFLGAGASETDINAALTNTGDAQCKTKNTVLRLDTQVAHNFLDDYVPDGPDGAFVGVQ